MVFGMLFALPVDPPAAAQHLLPGSTAEPVAQTELLRVLHSDESGLLLELLVPDYQIEALEIGGDTYDVLRLEGAGATSEPGKPQLPKIDALIGVPPDAEIRVLVHSAEASLLPGRYRLPPSPQPAPLTGEFEPGRLSYDPAGAEFADLDVYPQTAARLAEDAWLRDRRIARLELFPFQYLPAEGRLSYSPRILVEVFFERESAEDASSTPFSEYPTAGSDPFGDVLFDILLNAEAASGWRGIPRQAAVTSSPAVMSNPAYRIPIVKDGLYKLSYANLSAAGLDVGSLNPHNLHLTSQGVDVAVYWAGDGDNNFESGEYLAFYGQKFYGEYLAGQYQAEDDHWLTYVSQDISGAFGTWKPQMNADILEQYTRENVYWLSLEASPGLRMGTVPGAPGVGTPLAQTYRETVRAEESVYFESNQSWTLFSSEDNWLWGLYDTAKTIPPNIYTSTLTAVASGSYSATLRGEVVAISSNDSAGPDHHTIFYLNDTIHIQPIDDQLWDGKSRYSFETEVDHSRLVEGINELEFVVNLTPAMISDKIYFDWFEVEFEREFVADDSEITFTPSVTDTLRYQITGFLQAEVMVLDITYPFTPTAITGVLKNGALIDFNLTPDPGARYYAGHFTDLPPSQISYYDPPDLSQEADYLVITHQDFLAPAQQLANYRQAQGLSARVIDVQDLYNQFNYGIFSPLAIKNYFKYAFSQWTKPPEYAVLVGDGTWNMLGSTRYNNPTVFMPPYLAWVDPWGGVVDSANLLAAVVGNDVLPDLHISRIPVNTVAELAAVVDKVIAYEAAPPQDWQRSLMFVADNIPDSAGDFVQFSNDIISEFIRPGFVAQKLYENDFGCFPGVSSCPAINQAIANTLNSTNPITGTLIMNYVGHGAINRWASEQVWKREDLPSLTNAGKLPVVLSMTCLDAYWLHPGVAPDPQESVMELMLRMDDYGMAASFSPTGWGVTTGHDELHRGFFDSIFDQGNWLLGAAALQAKLSLFATGNNYDLINTFTVFGDPAMHISSPYSLEFSPQTQSGSGPPGSTVEYTFQITNTGAITDTIAFQAVGNTWQVDLPPDTLLLDGESTAVKATVHIPTGAADAQADSFTLRVFSKGDTSRGSQVQVTTTAYLRGVILLADPYTYDAIAGEVVTFELEVYNNGAFEDDFSLSLTGDDWETTILPSTIVTDTQPGESKFLQLTVQVPSGAVMGDSDTVTVTAASQGNPARTDTVILTTRLPLYRLFLPDIER